jgi:hypothetical protein
MSFFFFFFFFATTTFPPCCAKTIQTRLILLQIAHIFFTLPPSHCHCHCHTYTTYSATIPPLFCFNFFFFFCHCHISAMLRQNDPNCSILLQIAQIFFPVSPSHCHPATHRLHSAAASPGRPPRHRHRHCHCHPWDPAGIS